MRRLIFQICCLSLVIAQTQDYTNPVVAANCPDPGAIFYNGTYYVATTTSDNSDPDKFPIRTSVDMVNWNLVGYVFPAAVAKQNPSWANMDFWAPEIHLVSTTPTPQWRVYYTARDTKTGMLSIGVATASTPVGPYTDLGYPLLQNSSDGVIDATWSRDVTTNLTYLVWKVDGNADGNPTPILAAQLTPDGLSFTTPFQPTQLITNDQAWEAYVVEGPWVWYSNAIGMYYLFYSGNGYATPNYAIGIARAPAILGPYTKLSTNPILHTGSVNPAWAGPGHCSVLGVNGQQSNVQMLYHAWQDDAIGGNNPRMLLLDNVVWNSQNWPVVSNATGVPSQTPQPYPV